MVFFCRAQFFKAVPNSFFKWAILGLVSVNPVFAQPPAVTPPPQPAPQPQNAVSTSDSTPPQFLSVPGKSLMALRLHPSSYPAETELNCSSASECVFGLTRGFVVASDLLGVIQTPLFGPIREPGSWLLIDAALGYQFLQNVDGSYFANGSVGYRAFSFKDSESRSIDTKGVKFKIAYAQSISPVFSLGLIFQGFQGKVNYSGADSVYKRNNEGVQSRDTVAKFYRYSQTYPRVSLSLPADIEVMNWKNTHIDLPNHIRSYVKVEPFYIQNELELENSYLWIEKNFGMRLALTGAYEAPEEKSGRFSILASFGFDLASSAWTVDYKNKNLGQEMELPRRRVMSPYGDLQLSYLF